MLFAAWPILLDRASFSFQVDSHPLLSSWKRIPSNPSVSKSCLLNATPVQVNSACPGLPRPALIYPKTLCPLLSCDPVWFHPPCMLLILCDSVSSSTHFPAQSHCAYGLGSPGPWLEVQPANPGPSVNFHLGLHTRLLPRSFQVRFFIAIVIVWLFKFLRLVYKVDLFGAL